MPPRDQLVYLIFGKDQSFLEGRFSIVTAFAKAQAPLDVLVCTDQPERFSGFPIRTLLLTPQLQREWRGPDQFTLRLKIALLDHVIGGAERTILIDADTVWLDDPASLFQRIDAHAALMHADDGPITESTYYWADCKDIIHRLASGDVRLSDGQPLKFNDPQHMWNSGVVGVCREHDCVIRDALAINDQLYASSRWWFMEQLSFSIMLSLTTRLQPSTDAVEHYWSTISYPGWHGGKSARAMYHEQAAKFFSRHEGQSFEQMVQAMRQHPSKLYRISFIRQKLAAILRRMIARENKI